MILEELFKNDWHHYAASGIGKELEDFNVASNAPREDRLESSQNRHKESWVILGAEDSLKIKPKGSRLSYHERIHLYSLMKKSQQSLSMIAFEQSVSTSTLYKIKKEFERPVSKLVFEKPISDRILITSTKIQKLIAGYLSITRIPWTTKNIQAYLKSKVGITISRRIIRNILIKILNMRYKKGLARKVNFEEERQELIKQWFSIKMSKVIDSFDVLINIDESSFTRLTKKDFSWIPKGKKQIVKSISFRNSWSLVTAIFSTGSAIAAKSVGAVNSELFIHFLNLLAKFIEDGEKTKLQNCLVILDNASIHRSKITIDKIKSIGFSVAFIPQYSPEMAPIEHYFSKLKSTVINRARGQSIDWRSEYSNQLLENCMLNIHPEMVRRIWTSFSHELLNSLDLCVNAN